MEWDGMGQDRMHRMYVMYAGKCQSSGHVKYTVLQ